MYLPTANRIADVADVQSAMRAARTATLVTATEDGLIGTPLPMLLDDREGLYGTLYAHMARANSHWKLSPRGDAMAVFMGPQAYISPSWYATKQESHKVFPTWNYIAIHAYGPIEFFDDADRLLALVSRLTDQHEKSQAQPWSVTDAPADFIRAQLRGIIGLRIPISKLDGKRKMSQNRNASDRAGVIAGLSSSNRPEDLAVASLIPKE